VKQNRQIQQSVGDEGIRLNGGPSIELLRPNLLYMNIALGDRKRTYGGRYVSADAEIDTNMKTVAHILST
jgi:hypothetical protein